MKSSSVFTVLDYQQNCGGSKMKISLKRIIFVGVIILFAAFVYAATSVWLRCSSCGYQSAQLIEGPMMAGSNSIVYCPACKQFHSILTYDNPSLPAARKKAVQSTGKEDFEGAQRLTYPCPKCGSKAYDYQGPLCPICKKGNLTRTIRGNGGGD
jgi:rubrerythrin